MTPRPTFSSYQNEWLRIRNPSWLRYELQRRDGQTRQNSEEFFICRSVSDWCLDQLSDPENLHLVFEHLRSNNGLAAGIDEVDLNRLGSGEAWNLLRKTSAALKDQTYRPREPRPVQLRKPDGGFREISIQTVADRTVATALEAAIRPMVAHCTRLLHQDRFQLFRCIELAIRANGWFWLGTDDIEKCFDRVLVTVVMQCFAEEIDQPKLLRLIRRVILAHRGENESRGLLQGSALSPLAMELTLRKRLDSRLPSRDESHTSRTRYVDNVHSLGRDAQAVFTDLAEMNRLLEPMGMRLKGDEGPPVDLRDPSHGRVVLGLIPWWDEEREQLKLSVPGAAFNELRQTLEAAKGDGIPHPTVIQVITGFILAHGQALPDTEAETFRANVYAALFDAGFWEIPETWIEKSIRTARSMWASTHPYPVVSPWEQTAMGHAHGAFPHGVRATEGTSRSALPLPLP